MSKANRNDPCPCGSGLKYKKCCGQADAERKRRRRISHGITSPVSLNPEKPSGIQTFANKVMKVLSSPVQPATVKKAEVESASEERGYNSLEELIGIEGAPGPVKGVDEKEAQTT